MAALAIFLIAVAVAVVQASGSDDAAAPLEAPPAGAAEQPAAAQPLQQPAAPPPPAQPAAQQQPAPTAEAGEQQTAAPDSAAAAEETGDPLLGFTLPLAGACVSSFEGHWPGALRAYRNDGIHEGLDFYSGTACISIDSGTAVLAAKDGTVIRADRAYEDVTPQDWARFEAAEFAGEEILDELRGRQVWIDHGGEIVTRYAHLSAIAAPIFEGVRVRAGQVIGFVGESGQRESYAAPGSDLHLHFEIRVGAGWLGEGLEPQAARGLYLEAFGAAADGE